MKRLLSSIGVLAVVAFTACSDSGGSTPSPTLPTTLPSSIAATVGQKVCDIQAQLVDIVGQLQGTTLPSPADVASRLQDLQTQLQDEADTLESQGASPLSDQVRALADAVGQLATSVTGADPTAVISAAASVAAALSQIPGCPSPTPTSS
jgi:hypothetical protein